MSQGDDVAESSTAYGKVAYLGPDGTYGQQATRAFIDLHLKRPELKTVACPTISDAYYSVSEYTVLPLENTIFGAVTETLDCFFSKNQYIDNNQTASGSRSSSTSNEKNGARLRKGKEKEIIATLDLPIRHCLVVKRGTKMEDITWVKSHEQALGQSKLFLSKRLPNAKRIPTSSTALAAQSLLDPSSVEGIGAAICSKSVIGIHPELEVLHEGTQDRTDNFTRFILLQTVTTGDASEVPGTAGDAKLTPISSFYTLNSPKHIPSLLGPTSVIGSLHSRPIAPTITSENEEEGRYPTGIFIELISGSDTRSNGNGHQVTQSSTGDGVRYLGCGPSVELGL